LYAGFILSCRSIIIELGKFPAGEIPGPLNDDSTDEEMATGAVGRGCLLSVGAEGTPPVVPSISLLALLVMFLVLFCSDLLLSLSGSETSSPHSPGMSVF
jgi:hypothetical protein